MSLDRDIAAWLETIAVDTADTIRSSPSSTIVPTLQRPSTGGRRALSLLEALAAHAPTATAQLRPGEVIAEGGMGVIRLAEQVALGRTVAVKSLKPGRHGRHDPGAALDLLREAWVTGAVEHPNVVPVHHVGLDEDGSPQIVLKRIEGVEWSALIRDADAVAARSGATDLLAWNLGILLQVLNAVRFAHSRGILHRDLKPANVMIGEFGEVYLLDWGIAVSLRDDGSGRLPLAKDAREMAGTPCYLAPEMLGREGDPPLSERTDVYLTGAVLHEIITGRPPHDGDSALAVITKVLLSQPEMPPGVPAELARICLRAMRADPAERHPSIEALQADLRAYLEHRGSERLAEGARERLAQLLAALATPHPDPEAVYRLFGACRFGFQEALKAWPDNGAAREGLLRATVAVVEHELTQDPRAAVALLSELDDPPAELVARARAAAAAQAERQAALERLREQHDARIGTRTRVFLSILLGTMFTIFPLVSAVRPEVALHSHADMVSWSVVFLALVGALGFWARESLMRTAINRRLFAGILFMFACQTGLGVAAWRLDIPVQLAGVLWMFLWMVVSGMLSIAIDWRLTPASIAYAIAFAVAVRWPEHRLYATAAANFTFTVVAAWHWWPEQFRWTAEERERYRRRRAR